MKLDGFIRNHGFLGLHCVGTQVNGIIDNYGELAGIMSEVEMRDGQPYVEAIDVYGSINNFGYMRGNFRVQNSGHISGNAVENNNAYTQQQPRSQERGCMILYQSKDFMERHRQRRKTLSVFFSAEAPFLPLSREGFSSVYKRSEHTLSWG
ncbi:MAG: hypothetical protein J6A26_01535, partial [Oscillospiraceae bacterium]|nr:hypothetical protein [Oscillospiraceae bacterium]